MHLEVLWHVSHLHRALIVTEEALVQETPSRYGQLSSSPEPAECTKITDFLRLHSVPTLKVLLLAGVLVSGFATSVDFNLAGKEKFRFLISP